MVFFDALVKKKSEHRDDHAKKGFILALGGGGGRGLAHIGVFEVLEEHGLFPDAIVGTSIGALFGAMYALDKDAAIVRERALAMIQSETFSRLNLPVLEEADVDDQTWLSRIVSAARQTVLYTRAATGPSVADTDALIEITGTFCGCESCGHRNFEDLKIPLYVTAVQFPLGECRLFSKGSGVSLSRAIAASMAIPGVFDPIEIQDEKFVDGGVASELPAKEARMIASADQRVLAVNVGARPGPDYVARNVIEMLDWATQVKAYYLRMYKKQFADLVIEPLVGFTQWHDFSRFDQEIDKGRQAALEKMPELIGMLQS